MANPVRALPLLWSWRDRGHFMLRFPTKWVILGCSLPDPEALGESKNPLNLLPWKSKARKLQRKFNERTDT
jgi:hypothetical protein